MLDIGFQELLILMVVALLVFGPDKLPELGRRLGRAMREFRRASDEFRSTIETNFNITDLPLPPSATPVTIPDAATAAAVETPAEPAALPGEGAVVPAGEAGDGGVPSPAEIVPTDPFCAKRGGRLLHRSTCTWVSRIADSDRIAIKAVAEGWDLELKPCPVCDPRDTAALAS